MNFETFKRFRRQRAGVWYRTVVGVGVVYVYYHHDLGSWMWKIDAEDGTTVYAQSKYPTKTTAVEAVADHLKLPGVPVFSK